MKSLVPLCEKRVVSKAQLTRLPGVQVGVSVRRRRLYYVELCLSETRIVPGRFDHPR